MVINDTHVYVIPFNAISVDASARFGSHSSKIKIQIFRGLQVVKIPKNVEIMST